MDEINKQTGIVTLSCDHSFHFRCIDSWFTKQIGDDLDQTCPCCRSGGGEMDRCEVYTVDEEDEDDETFVDYMDAESQAATDMPDEEELEELLWERIAPGQWLIVSGREVAYEGVRNLFGPLNELEVEQENPQEVAARKIQAIFRGSRVRNTHEAAVNLLRLFQQAYIINP